MVDDLVNKKRMDIDEAIEKASEHFNLDAEDVDTAYLDIIMEG